MISILILYYIPLLFILFRVQERKYILTATNRRLADSSTSVVSTTLNLQIIPMPNNPDFPSPKTLASSLVNKSTELAARISNFDTTYEIVYSEVPRYRPKFIGNVILTNYTYYSASFSLSLNNYGWGYVVIIKEAEDSSKYPSPYQISLGYNQTNVPVYNYGSIEVTASYTNFNITLNNLESETKYNAYISAGSANPGYPDMMESKYVQKISFYTHIAPPSNFLKGL